MSSPSESSIPAPNIILASGSTSSLINSAASLTSNNPNSFPVTLINTAFAPPIDVSNKGDLTASLAASIALLSPFALPIPI